MKHLAVLIKSTILAALLFFTVSFLSILFQLAPFHYSGPNELYVLEIGFPFTYYQQFFTDNELHFGWFTNALFLDIAITWCATLLVVAGILKIKKKHT